MYTKDPILDFRIEDPRWRHIPHLATTLEAAAQLTFAAIPKKWRFPCTVTVLLTRDASMRKLNREFRGLDKPTNVLSFPQFLPDELTTRPKISEPLHLGDIALSYQYVVAEAERDGKNLTNHSIHLLIHGFLHLYGYDHMEEKEAARMEKLETTIMASMGLSDPYEHHDDGDDDDPQPTSKRRVQPRSRKKAP